MSSKNVSGVTSTPKKFQNQRNSISPRSTTPKFKKNLPPDVPSPPVIDTNRQTWWFAGSTMNVQCTAYDTSISWYLGDEELITRDVQRNETTVTSYLNELVTEEDDGQLLKCRTKAGSESSILVKVYFRPIVQKSLKKFAKLGESVIIDVPIKANPAPKATWSLRQYKFEEGYKDEFFFVHPMKAEVRNR